MYNVLHHILLVLYAGLPVAALLAAFWPGNARRRGRMASSLLLSGGAGVALGMLLTYFQAFENGALSYGDFVRAYFPQIARASYFVVGLLTLLKAFNALLEYASRQMCRRFSHEAALPGVVFVIRNLVMLLLGVPFFCAAMVFFLPRMAGAEQPPGAFEKVSLTTTDQFKLSAWWMPARGATHAGSLRDRTVILIHGLGGSKARELPLAQRLVDAGYNVLAIDLRAHGQSEGTFTSFGDLERRDVLAAVRFVKARHAAQSRRVYCVGAGIGAAASVAAAADDDPAAKQIDAVVAIGGYADFAAVPEIAAARFLPHALALAFARVAIPSLAAHAGADLADFSPGDLAGNLWPRPILVIHRTADALLPQEQSEALFDRASPPRREIWLSSEGSQGRRADVNDQLATIIDAFLRHAESVPVI